MLGTSAHFQKFHVKDNMPIITKPTEIFRGQKYTFVLSKPDVLAIPTVAAHDYFSDSANWNMICLFYRSSEGNQVETVSFHMNNGNIEDGKFSLTSRSRTTFQFRRMTIYDFDGGYLDLSREDIPDVALFDIGLDGESSGIYKPIISNFSANSVVIANMMKDDSIAQVGQSFSLIEAKTVNGFQFKAFRQQGATGTIRASIQDNNGVELAISNNIINVATLATSMSTAIFDFDILLPAGDYTVIMSSIGSLSNTISFGGSTSNPFGSGQLYTEGAWWGGYDLDFGVYEQNDGVVVPPVDLTGSIVWDITGPYTLQPNGGLTTTNTATYFNQYAPSDIKSGDFDITFTFASAPSHDAVAAMVTDSDSGYGFVGQYGNANLHYNSVGSQGFIAWISGENIFRMTRVGSTITMYLNGVVVGTTTYSGNLRPLVSMHTADVLTSAIIVIPNPDPIPDTDTIDNNPTGELQYMYYLLGVTPYDRHDISNSYSRSLIHGQSVILSSPVTISTVTFKMQRKPETMGGITYETMQGRIYLSILAGEELVGVMLADSSPIECMSISTSISDVTFTLLAPVNLPVGTYTLRLEGEHIIGNSYPPNGAWIKGYGFPSGATDGGALMGWGDNTQTGIYIYKYRTMSYYYLIN